MDPVHKRLLITGRVQGVWYRKSAVVKGTELGLVGTARNLPTGGVEVHVEGDPAVVEQFIEWCWQGPSRAKVDDVQVQPGELEGFDSFSVIP